MASQILIGLNINKAKSHEDKSTFSNRLVYIADEHFGTKNDKF